MSWWQRLFGGKAEAPAPTPAPPPARPLPAPLPATSEVAALRKLRGLLRGEALGDDEATAALRSMAGTSQERDALDAVRKASRAAALSEPLRVAAAELFFQRGEQDEALSMLDRASTQGGLSLLAEIQVARGDLGAACAALERVLARDIDAPGVRERLQRYRARLGLPAVGGEAIMADATLFTSARPETPFRIVAEAGRGGAAVVYEAEDEALGRKIALKVYHRPEDAREQLLLEARLAAEAAGPAVARVYDADADAGWIALEWAHGASLREHIRRRDLGWLLPVDSWLDPLLAALARLHRLGWAHGDLKPGNILFRAPGCPLLADFGSARRPGERWAAGTPGYLSPQRLADRPASLDDDIYALGRLAEDVAQALGPQAPERLVALAARCLDDARPASAEALLRGEPPGA